MRQTNECLVTAVELVVSRRHAAKVFDTVEKALNIVRLTEDERVMLAASVSRGAAAAQKIKHANVLLKVDAEGPAWDDERAAEVFGPARLEHQD